MGTWEVVDVIISQLNYGKPFVELYADDIILVPSTVLQRLINICIGLYSRVQLARYVDQQHEISLYVIWLDPDLNMIVLIFHCLMVKP